MDSINYITRSLDDVRKLIKACKKTGYCCFDYETNARPLYVNDFKPTLLSITYQPGSSVSIPLAHFQRDYYTDGFDWMEALLMIGHEVFQDRNIVKLAWNMKFDDQINRKYGIQCKGTCLDGMLAKYLLDEEKPNDLKSMVRKYLPDFADYEKENDIDKLDWDKKPLVPLAKYGGLDTDCCFRLTMFLESKLIKLGLYSVFRNMYMTASRLFTEVESNGLYLDREFNQKLLNEYAPKIEAAENEIRDLKRVKKFQKLYTERRVQGYIESIKEELEDLDPDDPKDKRKITTRENKIANIQAGVFTTKKELDLIRPVNLGSPVDLPELMYSEEGFNFPIIAYTIDKKTNKPTDKPSTAEDTLVELRLTVKNPESPKAIFLDKLLELRGLQKMYKTYILGWSEDVQDDNCLHGKFHLHGCVTGDTKLIGKESDITIRDICPKEPGILNVEKENIWVLSSECTWEQVTHTINKGKLPTYKVITSTGYFLKCTDGHKVLTTKGWKTVKQAFKNGLNIIMYDTSKFDITKPIVGNKSSDVLFKEIIGWPGYLVTNEGKVYSVKTQGGRGMLDYNHPHELVPRYLNGRPRVYLRNNTGKKTPFSVAHLVWLTFNNQTNIPSSMVIDHINGDPMDNRPENLQCITASENIKRAYKMTRSSYTNGSINGTNKFDTITIGKILEDYSIGITQREICHRYNISQKQVSGIVLKQRRKEIYLSKIISFEYIGEKYIYDLSVNDKHSYITRSNFINSNTTSGRLSSSEPNLQQVPKTSVDPNIKKQLIAKPGTLYIAEDYSQAELRIMAHLSQDETYLKAFREDKDPHLAIAAQKYGVSYDEAYKIYSDEEHPDHKIWKTRRKQAKQIVFGLIYGIQAKLLATKLSDPKNGIIVTPEESQQMMDDYFDQHPKIRKYMNSQERLLKRQGYIKSLFGTKRRLPGIFSENNKDVAYSIRLAVNFPCQSAASLMTMFGSILLYYDMKQGYCPPMDEVCTVHDAIYYNAKPEYINTFSVWRLWDTLRDPETKKYFGFKIDDVTMAMDLVIGRSMAEELPFIPGYDYNKMLDPNFSVEEYMEEHKKFKDIPIKDYPKVFPELFEQGKQWKK